MDILRKHIRTDKSGTFVTCCSQRIIPSVPLDSLCRKEAIDCFPGWKRAKAGETINLLRISLTRRLHLHLDRMSVGSVADRYKSYRAIRNSILQCCKEARQQLDFNVAQPTIEWDLEMDGAETALGRALVSECYIPAKDLSAEFDALVADKYTRPRDELLEFRLRLSTEAAVQKLLRREVKSARFRQASPNLSPKVPVSLYTLAPQSGRPRIKACPAGPRDGASGLLNGHSSEA